MKINPIKIKYLRKNKGYTLSNVSEYTGLTIGYLSRLENGSSKPSMEVIQKLANTYEVGLEEIVEKDYEIEKFVEILGNNSNEQLVKSLNKDDKFLINLLLKNIKNLSEKEKQIIKLICNGEIDE